MKILHIGSLYNKVGGPAISTYLTLKGLNTQGVNARIAMPFLGYDEKLRGNDIPMSFLSKPIEKRFYYSPSLKKEIINLGDFDIYHAQGVWQYPTYALVDVAKKKGSPYVITPRGMLYPQDIDKNSAFIKKLSLKLRLLKDLNNAACVHVTCNDEMLYCRDLGVTSPIAVIPNPVEIIEYKRVKKDHIRRIGYLGRLSRRKRIECLIQAFYDLGGIARDAELLIIGGGDKEYEKDLHRMVERYQLKNIRFTGFLYGEEKEKEVASCSVLAMPSEFENFGNVITEGLVKGIPCIATTGSPWEELNTHDCGWWVSSSQDAITKAICDAIKADQKKLDIMGENGKKLMKEKYSVSIVSDNVIKLYKWILREGIKPSFVYL